MGKHMTHDWIPNTELNERVARALGWTQHTEYKHLWYGPPPKHNHAQMLPNFSGDMTAAWIVVEWLRVNTKIGYFTIREYFYTTLESENQWIVGFAEPYYDGDNWIIEIEAKSGEVPLAICKAALLAFEKNETTEKG